eukprot:778347-Rhodomonas_salina.1
MSVVRSPCLSNRSRAKASHGAAEISVAQCKVTAQDPTRLLLPPLPTPSGCTSRPGSSIVCYRTCRSKRVGGRERGVGAHVVVECGGRVLEGGAAVEPRASDYKHREPACSTIPNS